MHADDIMDVDEFEGFSIERNFIRGSYRGLRENEERLLRGYLEDVGTHGLQRVRTSWPVGQGEIPATLPPALRQLGQNLSKWKVDVILDWSGKTEIIELKSRATHTAGGQAVFYSMALGEEPEERTDFKLSAVAFRFHPDFEKRAQKVGIHTHAVPGADRSTATERAIRDRLQDPLDDD